MLRIDVIGTLRLSPPHKIPRKARALLAYVALHEGACVSRTKLADLLWPHQGPEPSRHSLRNCLMELRKELRVAGALDCLHCDFTKVWLTGFSTDIHEYQSLCNSGRIAEAVKLCRGELFEGFELASEPFGKWIDGLRQQFSDSRSSMMLRLASALNAGGKHEEAMSIAKKAIAVDPWNEILHRLYMTAAAKAHRRGDAIRHYRCLVNELRRELATSPDQETIELAVEMGANGHPSAPRVSAIPRFALLAVENRWREIDVAVRGGLKPKIPPALIRETIAVLEAERLRSEKRTALAA